MSARFLGGLLLALGLATPVAAQDGVPPLERIIDISVPVDASRECSVPGTVLMLARRFEMLAGIEYPRSPCAKMGATQPGPIESINLRGMTVEEALARLASIDPRYRIIERDGVVVVRPVTAWSDPKNVLNFGSPSFVLEDATLGIALDAVVSAMVGERSSPTDRFGTATEQGARRFSLKTGAVSAGEALDAIVRAHGASVWVMRDGEIGRVVFFHTFDGSGIGSGRRGLQ